MEFIPANVLANAFDYRTYRNLVTSLLAEGKLTGPGVPLNDEMLEYTRLNEQRMSRIEKTFRPDDEAMALLAQTEQPITWLVITEGWCGDAAQIVPILQKMAESNPNITLRFILRDQHLEVMDAFLTDGGRSIPKLLFIDPENGRIMGHWGPRPVAVQAEMTAWASRIKATTDGAVRKQLYEEAKTAVHTWYAHDKAVSTQREVAAAQSQLQAVP